MRKYFATLLCASLTAITVFGKTGMPSDAAEKTTFAALNYSYTNLHDTETDPKYINAKDPKTVISGGKINLDLADKYGSKDGGYKFTTGSGTLFATLNGDGRRKLEWSGDEDKFSNGHSEAYAPVMTAGKKNLWNTAKLPYFEIQFSTKGYENITFSSSIGATKKAPKSYRLAYRVGSSGNYNVLSDSSASLSLAKNKVLTSISADLPKAAENQEKVMVKIYAVSSSTVGGGTLNDDRNGGKIAINNIAVRGTEPKKESKPTQKPTPKQTEKPQQGPPAIVPATPTQNQPSVPRAVISSVTLKKKKVTVSIKKVTGASGYQVKAGSDKKITKNTRTAKVSSIKAVIKKWKPKKCYVKVRAYKISTGKKKIYGQWSVVKKA